MLRPGEKKEPRGVVYLGVEDHMDDSKDFKVPGPSAVGTRSPGGGRLFLTLPSPTRSFLARSPGMGGPGDVRAACFGVCVPSKTGPSQEGVLNVMDDYGNTPLHWAAGKNQVESVKFLLRKGANPNLRNCDMMAPLHVAVQGLYNDVMKVLIEHRTTDVNLEGENGNTALIIACFTDNSEAVQLLGADIDITDSEGRSPLILATASASWNTVNLLLSKGTKRD
ncbi:hypothetical protein J1605_001823 [Eschrichtius robustus]|uniref:Uncharacterized protein n=1 Tax=Eschrichtius robustus TaxID=9764 RepID=A0AB34HY00_ESCRO|nr:hypothetical protein J1605_001823 [Eschrichtius robustus]